MIKTRAKKKEVLFALLVAFLGWPFFRGSYPGSPPAPPAPPAPPVPPAPPETHPKFKIGDVIGRIYTEQPPPSTRYVRVDVVNLEPHPPNAPHGLYEMPIINPYSPEFGWTEVYDIEYVDQNYELWPWQRYD